MIALLARFSLVGILNSVVGFAIIAILDLGLHLKPAFANALGYLVGIVLNFFLARGFVFRSRDRMAGHAWRYSLAMALAFLLNQLVLWNAGLLLGAGSLPHLVAQAMGLGTYPLANFLLCRYWVFREKAAGI